MHKQGHTQTRTYTNNIIKIHEKDVTIASIKDNILYFSNKFILFTQTIYIHLSEKINRKTRKATKKRCFLYM